MSGRKASRRTRTNRIKRERGTNEEKHEDADDGNEDKDEDEGENGDENEDEDEGEI